MITGLVTLKKRITDDGLVEVHEDVCLGKYYIVDMGTKQMATGYNFRRGKEWRREIINTVGDSEGWLPTEILEFINEGEPTCCGGVPLHKGRCTVCGGKL
jgi:hypothetical protein